MRRATACIRAHRHGLAKEPLGSEGYRRALADVVSSFVTRASLSQVRWNGGTTGLRELHLGPDGRLSAAPLRNTPPRELDGSPALVELVRTHADDVAHDHHLLGPSFLATVARPDPRPWMLPGVDSSVGRAFAQGTCGGCHARDALDGGFHISPLRRGPAKVSPMLQQDLARRSDLLRRATCGT